MSAGQKASQTTSSPLLHNKLMPPRLNSKIIRRDDLLSRLDQGLHQKLTIVTAPTGFGKTTLVSMWIASRQFISAWVTLDQNDNDAVRFWTYVVSALRTLDFVHWQSNFVHIDEFSTTLFIKLFSYL